MNTHTTSAILMALDDFRNYAAAKIEVYEDVLYEHGITIVNVPLNRTDRGRIDEWKARIIDGDDRYPEGPA